MKRFFTITALLTFAAIVFSCQKVEKEYNVPYVSTFDAEDITDCEARLMGAYSGLDGFDYGALNMYFIISTDRTLLESYDRSREYGDEIIEASGWEKNVFSSANYECDLSGLAPATTYYYFFAIYDGYSEARGQIHSFTTEELDPEILDVRFYGDYYYSGGYVYYDVEVDTNVDISAYTDVEEYGIWVSLGTQTRFYPCTDSGNTLTAKIAVPESEFDVDTESYYCSAEVTDCKVGVYKDAEVLCKVNVSGLEYDIQPEIQVTVVESGSIYDISEENWDKELDYDYSFQVNGLLFMDKIYEYFIGNWTNEGEGGEYELSADGTYSYQGGIKYNSSNTSTRTNYIQLRAMVGDREISSKNCIAFYLSGTYCRAYLHYGGVSETSSVKSSAMRLSIMKENADVPVCKVN